MALSIACSSGMHGAGEGAHEDRTIEDRVGVEAAAPAGPGTAVQGGEPGRQATDNGGAVQAGTGTDAGAAWWVTGRSMYTRQLRVGAGDDAVALPEVQPIPSETHVRDDDPAIARDAVDGGTAGAGGVEPEGGIEALVCSYSWPCDEALRVMRCESGGDPGAVSPDGQNIGLFQVNVIHGYYAGLEENVAKAHAIWLDYGGHWTAWSCKP